MLERNRPAALQLNHWAASLSQRWASEIKSDAMNTLEHLFLVGEFPERAHLLSGLTLEQVTLRPDGASHSIYEELWHVVAYKQSIIAAGDPAGDRYPSAAPEHEHQWHDLVRVFLEGARVAAAMGQAPGRLVLGVEPGGAIAGEPKSRAGTHAT